jgi:transcriptional regulator with XRE-family HTH domain
MNSASQQSTIAQTLYRCVFHKRLVSHAFGTKVGYCNRSLKKTSPAPDPFYVATGKALRLAREGKKITQEQVGIAVGLSRTSINNIEKGRQKMLLDTFCNIAQALSEAPDVLLASCMKGEAASAVVDKRLRGLVPEEQQFIQEGIAQMGRRRK